MKKQDEEKFLEQVSGECYLDKDTVKEVYMGILRALTRSLRREDRFLLPDIVDFSLVEYKSKRMFNPHAGGIVQLPETRRVKAVVDYKLKKISKLD